MFRAMSDRKITTTLRLSESTRAALKAAAAEDVRSMSSAVELACRHWLAERAADPRIALPSRRTLVD